MNLSDVMILALICGMFVSAYQAWRASADNDQQKIIRRCKVAVRMARRDLRKLPHSKEVQQAWEECQRVFTPQSAEENEKRELA